MRVSPVRAILAIVVAISTAASLSCAHDQQLVSISIVPDTQTFGASNIPVPADAGLSVRLRALGKYIHPPVTKDITGQVTWTTGQMTANVVCFTGSNGNTALLTVLITPAGDGTVSVSAPGQSAVTCTQNCTLSFPIGTGPITLTAAPNSGFTFVGYSNCQTQSGLQCTINPLNVDTTVTATFR